MAALADRLAAGAVLHLDWLDYAERLLGPADWADAAGVAGLIGKAQALLPSDLILLPASRVASACLAARPALRLSMGAKPGAHALRILLDDGSLAGILGDMMARLGPAPGGALLGLSIPAPLSFASLAASGAGLPLPDTDEDLVDDAAVYVAAFLRMFATAPIALLHVAEAPGDAQFRELAAPIVRVAAHYGWPLSGLDGACTLVPSDEQDVWSGGAALPLSGLVSVTVPPGTEPEAAAAAVARLRSAMKEQN